VTGLDTDCAAGSEDSEEEEEEEEESSVVLVDEEEDQAAKSSNATSASPTAAIIQNMEELLESAFGRLLGATRITTGDPLGELRPAGLERTDRDFGTQDQILVLPRPVALIRGVLDRLPVVGFVAPVQVLKPDLVAFLFPRLKAMLRLRDLPAFSLLM
jgi:hypothetical protein